MLTLHLDVVSISREPRGFTPSACVPETDLSKQEGFTENIRGLFDQAAIQRIKKRPIPSRCRRQKLLNNKTQIKSESKACRGVGTRENSFYSYCAASSWMQAFVPHKPKRAFVNPSSSSLHQVEDKGSDVLPRSENTTRKHRKAFREALIFGPVANSVDKKSFRTKQ